MENLAPIIYVDSKTGQEVHEYFHSKDHWKLEQGKIIKAVVAGKESKRFRIVDIQANEFNTKVYIEPIAIDFGQIIKLLIIATLCWYIFDAWWWLLME